MKSRFGDHCVSSATEYFWPPTGVPVGCWVIRTCNTSTTVENTSLCSTFEHPKPECSCNISCCEPNLHQTVHEKNANIYFYLTFNWLGLIGI